MHISLHSHPKKTNAGAGHLQVGHFSQLSLELRRQPDHLALGLPKVRLCLRCSLLPRDELSLCGVPRLDNPPRLLFTNPRVEGSALC